MTVPVVLPFALDLSLTYYISGPMSGYENYNYTEFGAVQRDLEAAGLKTQSPHTNEWPSDHLEMETDQLWLEMMKKCYAQMEQCQALIQLRGWPSSKGARGELIHALDRGWPVYYLDRTANVLLDLNRDRTV